MKKTSGSVWNANSWHWEEKNYTKWSKEIIKKLIEGYKFHEGNFEFELSKVFSIEGEVMYYIGIYKY